MPISLPTIGALPAGPRNSITDVAGITVGHATIAGGDIQTGVTVVRPHAGDPFVDKVPAACAVINGFGKSIGLVQVEELGVLETPIALTNTFAVGAVAQAQIRQAVDANPQIGRTWSTVNPLVFECNDGYLNDLQAFAVQDVHYEAAYAAAGQTFEQGAIGAGRGMSSFGVKGGIGSASRVATLADGSQRTVGALVLSNFGVTENLTLAGHHVGAALAKAIAAGAPEPEKGSIIMLLATDAPLDARQLRRLALRAGAGLARTGSVYGHGSGDIALAFSTAYTVPHQGTRAMPSTAMTHESHLDPLFQAAADSVEQAIVHALFHAEAVTGRDGHTRRALTDLL
ncbi:peptidase S58 family protein [Ralstonia insidiosa]|uniref:Peptidase S58 family protein n=1 Tax=Ralstonia insidiosa TaxID=190721 RepID=A0AAC9BK78_9RALS|nr:MULTISPECIES: P1 family peptidase [Ralstonia]ANH74073.1 peptidase S58 family protein [Ralstonia insidiosa]EPX98348.1 D-aminopeptidase [Ralstonia sp. AU12-08]MBY4704391.1 P1 family peptidase [Ralstonia insidiosa]GAQ30714.1 peptidase S58 DmpA [Ralstonia sp. NT80]